MSFLWLEELLPPAMISARTRIWWALFFALFPLAYVGGVMLERSEEGPARMMGFQDRAASIRTAEEFAATKGFPVNGWHQYAIVETRDSLMAYYAGAKQPEAGLASAVAPAREVQVLFRSPDQSHEFRAYLSLSGQITGYDFGKSSARNRIVESQIGEVRVNTTTTSTSDGDAGSMKNAIALSDSQAESIARGALAEKTELNRLVQLGPAKVSTNSDDPVRRDVTWDGSLPDLKGLTLHIAVSVRDLQVVAFHVEGAVEGSGGIPKRKLPVFLISSYSIFLTFGVFYAIYRYAKRTLQKEVSHLRTLVVAALFAVSYGTMAYSVAVDQVATRVSGETFAKIGVAVYVGGAIGFAIMGLLVGIGYGSGEGEVREAYPGKLTSLDALLAGRIFSRDVAASLLFGAAAAGWLLLAHRFLSRFLDSDIASTRSDVVQYTFSRLPWLTMLVGRQYDSLLVAVTGLLLPAAFLLRRSMRKSWRFVSLIVFALLSVTRDASKYPTVGSALVAMAVFAAALLLPFFGFDLLAAMVSLSALAFVDQLARLSSVFPSWTGLALWLAASAALALAVAAYLALRGEKVNEEEVRPVYANNLAERMSLQAEVLAAREAQLRLLPQAPPELSGIHVAACCLPAHGVGGDFYDFFRLDATRVGIFVAQGGDQGLASALCIALAKGVLMHATLQPQAPAQIIAQLESSIAELLESGSGSGISFAYGVLDARRSVLNYARIGTSPRFVVYRQHAQPTTSAQLERTVAIAGRAPGATPIYEGAVQANAGDFLVFFTQGVTCVRVRRFGRREYQWLDALMRQLQQHREPLQTSLLSALGKYRNRASDDLTAVVIHIVESTPVAQEVVA